MSNAPDFYSLFEKDAEPATPLRRQQQDDAAPDFYSLFERGEEPRVAVRPLPEEKSDFYSTVTEPSPEEKPVKDWSYWLHHSEDPEHPFKRTLKEMPGKLFGALGLGAAATQEAYARGGRRPFEFEGVETPDLFGVFGIEKPPSAAETSVTDKLREKLYKDIEDPQIKDTLQSAETLGGFFSLQPIINMGAKGINAVAKATSVISQVSKQWNISKLEAVKRLWQEYQRLKGIRKPNIDPRTGTVILGPAELEDMTNLAEKRPEILVGEVVEKKPTEQLAAEAEGEIVPTEPITTPALEKAKPVVGEKPAVTDFESLTPKQQEEYSDLLTKAIASHTYSAHQGKKVPQTKESAQIYRSLSELPYLNAYDRQRFASIASGIEKPEVIEGKGRISPAEKPITFETAKGSRYTVEGDKTTRIKAPRPEHPGEEGPQPKSEVTYYLTPDDVQKLHEIQTEGGPQKRITKMPDGNIGIQYLEGPDKGKFEKRSIMKPQPSPKVGLTPLELWNEGKRSHFGNVIVKIAPVEPKLTEQQIRNRKIAEVERKKAEIRRAKELQVRKEAAEKERMVAFKILGIDQPKEAASEIKENLIPDNPDAEDLRVVDEGIDRSTDDALKAQLFAEAQMLNDKIAHKMQTMFSKFNVEAPFQAVGASKTGRAVKLFHDTQNAYLEEARGLIKKLGDLKLSDEQLWDALLAAESGKELPIPEMNQARDLIRKYFDESFTKYKSEGGLSLPWPQSAIARLEQEIVDLKTKLTEPNIKKQALGKINNEILEIRKTIALLKTLKYIPKSAGLITQALADAFGDIDPKYLHRFAISAHKKRTTGALSDWIDKEPRIKEVLHPYDFIGHYAGRKGRDIALLRVVKSAIDDGLASKGEKLGFKMDPFKFPALAGYYVHPALFEYINNLANPIPFNTYDKISRFFKTAIVFDPTYLGTLLPYFRTLMQNPKYLARVPRYWKKAIHDFFNCTPEYIRFIELGGASNPYPETKDFNDWLDKEKLNKGSPIQTLFNTVLSKPGAKDLMNKIANFSWITDRIARMAYYNMLIDKGLSAGDAAKLAAENFVDYSKLPAKTRRWLGRIFFAPATQVLSLINDIVLTASPFQLVRTFITDKENFQNDRINRERVGLLIGTVIALAGMSALYKAWGFKEDEFGTRYSAEFEKDGRTKEVVVTPTHPLNYSLRWINTFWRGFGPGESSPVEKLWGRMAGQIGPVPALVLELGKNQNREGKKIWDPVGDNAAVALAKVFKYALGKAEPFGVEKFHTVEDRKAARNKVKEMMGWAEWFMDSVEFLYERKNELARVKGKINYLKREMKRLQKDGTLTEDARERYQKAIEEIIESSAR